MSAFEEKLSLKNQEEKKCGQVKVHPLLKKLEINLSKYIFGLHEEQYILSHAT